MLRKLLLLSAAMTLLLCGLLSGRLLWGRPPQSKRSASPSISHVHAGPTIEQVRSLASLTVLKVDVADVQVSGLHGYTGGVQAALVVKGDLTLSTDLNEARFLSVDPRRRAALLVVPPPRVSSPRVDHDRTRVVWLWQYGTWRFLPGDRTQAAAVNRAYAEAQNVVATAGGDRLLGERARAQAEAVLRTFFAALDWTVSVRWADRVQGSTTLKSGRRSDGE
jgi:hypothetical protein